MYAYFEFAILVPVSSYEKSTWTFSSKRLLVSHIASAVVCQLRSVDVEYSYVSVLVRLYGCKIQPLNSGTLAILGGPYTVLDLSTKARPAPCIARGPLNLRKNSTSLCMFREPRSP